MNYQVKYLLAIVVCVLVGVLASVLSYRWNHLESPRVSFFESTQTISTPTTEFSIAEAPKNSLRGNITQLSGHVSWQSRTASEASLLLNPGVIQQGERLIASDDGHVAVSFGRAGSIVLSPKSAIELIQLLPVQLVFLQTKGFVEYQADEAPIGVRAVQLLTTIESGVATINVDDRLGEIVIKMKEGKATAAYNNAKFISQVRTLHTGDVFVYDIAARNELVE